METNGVEVEPRLVSQLDPSELVWWRVGGEEDEGGNSKTYLPHALRHQLRERTAIRNQLYIHEIEE